MADETSKPKLVEIAGGRPETSPGSIFDDLASLRKTSKLTVQRKSVLVNVKVDKPPGDTYFRCHHELYLDNSTVIRDAKGTSRAIYYVCPQMRSHPKLVRHLRWVTLVLTSTWPVGDYLIWPVPILGERPFAPWRSARTAYELALKDWVMMTWDDGKNDYHIEPAEEITHEPIWPDKNFEELLKIGFDGKIIDNEDHHYARHLRGLD